MTPENKLYLKVKDHSVSKEYFDLFLDEELDMLFTFPQPSLDQLSKYYESEDYISHTNHNRTFIEKLYQLVREYTLNRKIKLINEEQPQKGNLLDIGAGTGDFLYKAKSQNWSITGIEPNKKANEIAKKRSINLIEESKFLEDNSFDAITMWHVLEHVPDLENQIKELKRLLKKTGTIFIAVPNFKSYDAKHYGEFWAAFDVPIHFWHFSKNSIVKIFEKENIKLNRIIPMKFDSFYISMLSEKYKTGKINFIKAFFIGFISNLSAIKKTEYSSHIYVLKNE